jgi:ATP-binding protein involved in chromosome partitioning
MPELTQEAVRNALKSVLDPQDGRDIVSAGLIEQVLINGAMVHLTLTVPRARAATMEQVREAAERAVKALPGVANATAVLTAHREAQAAPPAPPAGIPDPRNRPKLLADVKAVIAVASGKGGVGKSTVAVNLAVALAQRGLSVGLLDADIYGPSQPRMLGLAGRPEVIGDRMQPLEAHGIKAMSIGFIADTETAMIWRGPMVMGALEQMMGQCDWGALDVMVVDMPPGTGDAQLTMAQRTSLAGAVIVSTPQDIALIDARRAVRMFEKVNVKVLGIVENMSVFCCPNCGHQTSIFGHGGAKAEAVSLGVPFLGEIPLQAEIRATGDAGRPIAALAPESEAARAYRGIAASVMAALALA